MNHSVVMDTNVAVVANGRSHAGYKCAQICIETLLGFRKNRCLLLDHQGLIIEEYRKHLSPSGQPGPGDAFFRWLWNNQANPQHCRQVQVRVVEDQRGFEEFPDDPRLVGLDPSDHKFVAVAVASEEQPTILNASDTDWWSYQEALRSHGIQVLFLCPELMRKETTEVAGALNVSKRRQRRRGR